MNSAANITTTGLCLWALRYAWRRPLPLAVVLMTMLVRVGLDVLKRGEEQLHRASR